MRHVLPEACADVPSSHMAMVNAADEELKRGKHGEEVRDLQPRSWEVAQENSSFRINFDGFWVEFSQIGFQIRPLACGKTSQAARWSRRRSLVPFS